MATHPVLIECLPPSCINCKVLIIKKEVLFTGKPASLYWQTMPDWVFTIAIGKLKYPQSNEKRLDRSEKREAKKKASDAAQSLLLLHDEEESY